MNTSTMNRAALDEIGLVESDAAELLMLEVQRTELRAQLAVVQRRYIAKLPFATEEQLAQVVLATRRETALPEGSRLNVDFRLSDVQGQQVEMARKARMAELEAGKTTIVGGLMNSAEEKLVSFKVRVGTKATTTNLRFVRSHGIVAAPKSGLLAKIAAAVTGPVIEGQS